MLAASRGRPLRGRDARDRRRPGGTRPRGAATVATRIDAWYVAFDLDAIDAGEGLALAMTETDGISVADAVAAVRIVAGSGPVAGIGATAAMDGDAATWA